MTTKILANFLVSPRGGSSRQLKLSRNIEVTCDSSGLISRIEELRPSSYKLKSKRKYHHAQLVIPGLVDPHTHLLHAGNRSAEWGLRLKGLSYQEIAKKGGGIRNTTLQTRRASSESLIRVGQRVLKNFLSFGVTTLEAKSGYGLDLESELKLLKTLQRLKKKSKQSILSTYMGAHALAPEFSSTKSYVDKIIEDHLPKVQGLAQFQDVFVERGYFGKSESIRLLQAGKKYGLIPKVHAHEFGRTGGVEVAYQVKAVSADHLQYVNEADLQKMKSAKIVPVVLPGTSFFLGAKKFAPARKMWDYGLPVAISTDFNPGTNPSINLPLMGTFAAIHEALLLEEVLVAQTKHAALALGLKDRGVLEPGYRADFVCLEAENFERMYYHYGQSLVESVFIEGKKVFG